MQRVIEEDGIDLFDVLECTSGPLILEARSVSGSLPTPSGKRMQASAHVHVTSVSQRTLEARHENK